MGKPKFILVVLFVVSFMIIGFKDQIFAMESQGKKYDINKSATDQNITFTIDDIVDNRLGENEIEGIKLEYLIQSKTDLSFNSSEGIPIQKPVIFIDGKMINHSESTTMEKIGKNRYKGEIEIVPTNTLPKHFKMKVLIGIMFKQKGNWTVDLEI